MGFTALPVLLPFRFRFRSVSRAIQLCSLWLSPLFTGFPAPPLFPSADPFGPASVFRLSTFRFLAAAFFFRSFELLFSAFRLPLFRASSRLRLLSFRTFPRSFGLLLTYSYLFPFGFSFRSCLRSGFPLSLPARLLFRSFELLFRPAVSLLFRAYLRFRFFGFRHSLFPSAFPFGPASVFRLSAFQLLALAFFFHSFELLFSAFRLSSLSGFLTAPASFLSDFPAGLLGLPTLLPCSFRSAFRLRFRFWLSAFASCPGLLLFRAFCPAFSSALSNFFSGLPSLFPFGLPYGLGFRVLFRIFSNPENDTDETLTTSGALSRFCESSWDS